MRFQLLPLMPFLHSLKFLTRYKSFPCTGASFIASPATFVNSLMRSSHVLNTPWTVVCERRCSKVAKICMLAGEMLRSGEGRSWSHVKLPRQVGQLDGLGRGTLQVFGLSGRKRVLVIHAPCPRRWRGGEHLAESFSLVGCTCGLPLSISFVCPNEKEEETPREP